MRVCAGVWVWACLCVDVSVCAGVSSGRVCVWMCLCVQVYQVGVSVCSGVWVCGLSVQVCGCGQVCVCRCVGVGVCLHMCSVWGDLNHTL